MEHLSTNMARRISGLSKAWDGVSIRLEPKLLQRVMARVTVEATVPNIFVRNEEYTNGSGRLP